MLELTFRVVMIVLIITLAIYCAFISPMPVALNWRSLMGLGILSICVLIFGPFWPHERNLQRLDNFFDQYPRMGTLICFFTIAVTGFSMAWLAMHGSFQSSSRLSNRIIYDALGPVGLASVGVAIGVIGIVGILNALKKQS